jgi:hypothetical protein
MGLIQSSGSSMCSSCVASSSSAAMCSPRGVSGASGFDPDLPPSACTCHPEGWHFLMALETCTVVLTSASYSILLIDPAIQIQTHVQRTECAAPAEASHTCSCLVICLNASRHDTGWSAPEVPASSFTIKAAALPAEAVGNKL